MQFLNGPSLFLGNNHFNELSQIEANFVGSIFLVECFNSKSFNKKFVINGWIYQVGCFKLGLYGGDYFSLTTDAQGLECDFKEIYLCICIMNDPEDMYFLFKLNSND